MELNDPFAQLCRRSQDVNGNVGAKKPPHMRGDSRLIDWATKRTGGLITRL
jgi:hypothetical protein